MRPLRLGAIALGLLAAFIMAPISVEAAVVTVSWDRNAEPDVTGYVVYYGTQSHVYSVSRDVGNQITWISPDLANGTYYFAVQAYNLAGLRSDLSVEVSTTIGVTTPPPAECTVDAVAPALAITSPSNGQTVSTTSVTISGTATDQAGGGCGIASVTVNGVAASGGTTSGTGTAAWTRTLTLGAGANHITVVARDNSTAGNATTRTIDLTYTPAVVISGVTANRSFPLQLTTPAQPVTWTAAATGGTATLHYRFWLFNQATGAWTILKDYDPGNSVTWTPTASGTYTMQVWVRSAGSTANYEAWIGVDPFSVVGPEKAALVDVTSDLTSGSASPGTPITVTATAHGVSPQYQFWLFNGSAWSVLQPYSVNNSVTWTPTTSGTYSMQVWVRNTGSSDAWEDWRSVGPVPVTDSVSLQDVSANVTFPVTTGTPITWTARAAGPGTLEYRFWLYSVNFGTWQMLRDYASSDSVTWTPAASEAGSYVVQVWVRRSGSTAAYQDWKATDVIDVTGVELAVTDVSCSPATGLRVGQAATWTATADAGDQSALEYQFWLYRAESSAWTILRAYRTSPTVSWTPDQAGTYVAQVWVRRVGSTATWEAWKTSPAYTVASNGLVLTAITFGVPFPANAKTPIRATASISGTGTPEYQFWLYDISAGTWQILRAYGSTNNIIWTPTRAGSYRMQVWVRRVGSTAAWDDWKGTADLVVR